MFNDTEMITMGDINFFDLVPTTQGPPGNKQVRVSIAPVPGNGQTQLGMFNIAVNPLNPKDQLLSVQFIVQYAGETPTDFTAFILFGNPPAGGGFSATMFAGNDAVEQNRAGKALTVSVVGGVNTTPNLFFISQTFTSNLWPPSA